MASPWGQTSALTNARSGRSYSEIAGNDEGTCPEVRRADRADDGGEQVPVLEFDALRRPIVSVVSLVALIWNASTTVAIASVRQHAAGRIARHRTP